MTEPEYATWLEAIIPEYAVEKVASGQWSEGVSLELSKKGYQELLPQGLETPDNYLFTIVDPQATPVGVLWFAVKTKFNACVANIFDVRIRPERQGERHAYRALLALEDKIRELGLSGIALHVFGHNKGAQGPVCQVRVSAHEHWLVQTGTLGRLLRRDTPSNVRFRGGTCGAALGRLPQLKLFDRAAAQSRTAGVQMRRAGIRRRAAGQRR